MWVPAGMLEWTKGSKEMREIDEGLSKGRISQGCCVVSLGHHICFVCEAENQELDFPPVHLKTVGVTGVEISRKDWKK